MAEIVNLRLHRKRKARDDRQGQAAANRARFGQPKALREAEAGERERAERQLDGHRREPETPDDLP